MGLDHLPPPWIGLCRKDRLYNLPFSGEDRRHNAAAVGIWAGVPGLQQGREDPLQHGRGAVPRGGRLSTGIHQVSLYFPPSFLLLLTADRMSPDTIIAGYSQIDC